MPSRNNRRIASLYFWKESAIKLQFTTRNCMERGITIKRERENFSGILKMSSANTYQGYHHLVNLLVFVDNWLKWGRAGMGGTFSWYMKFIPAITPTFTSTDNWQYFHSYVEEAEGYQEARSCSFFLFSVRPVLQICRQYYDACSRLTPC